MEKLSDDRVELLDRLVCDVILAAVRVTSSPIDLDKVVVAAVKAAKAGFAEIANPSVDAATVSSPTQSDIAKIREILEVWDRHGLPAEQAFDTGLVKSKAPQ